MNTFGRDIYNDKITLKEADKDQSSLLVEIMNFKKKTKLKNPEKKLEKKDVLKNLYEIFAGRERVLDAPTWNKELELPDGSYFLSDI